MPSPTIGRRRRWAPPSSAKVDWSHPLCPGTGWIPAMGMVSLHGQLVQCIPGGTLQTVGPGIGPWGLGWVLSNASPVIYGWPNPITANTNRFTFASWRFGGAILNGYNGTIFTRNGTIPASGIAADPGGTKWNCSWNDDSNTYSYSGGPVIATVSNDEFVVAVINPTTIDIWVNGSLQATNSTATNSAIDFTILTGDTAWMAGDSFGLARGMGGTFGCYYAWPRALGAAEIARLVTDPYCFLRW